MRLVTQNEKFVVYDDLLSSEDYKQSWNYVQGEDYFMPHVKKWLKVWRLTDNHPYGSTEYKWSERPFGNGMDALSNLIMETAGQHKDMLGKWNEVHFRCYLYPRDSKLSWHNDVGHSAAVVYYVHPKWAASWGGELLVAEVPKELPEMPQAEASLDRPWDDAVIGAYGIGQYVSSVPNRMIIMPSGVFHAINRVDPDAGDHVRCSIVAFFKLNQK